jgi:hypothetical protein
MSDNILRFYQNGQSFLSSSVDAAAILAAAAANNPFANNPNAGIANLLITPNSFFLTNAASSNTGTNTSAFGGYAANSNTGAYTSAFGVYAASSNTGANTSAFGVNAAFSNTGTYTSAFGVSAAYSNTHSNVTCLGYDSQATGANQVQLGNVTTTVYHSGIAARSDRRDKRNITPLNTAKWVSFFTQVAPFKHVWDKRDSYRFEQSPKDADGNITRLIPFAEVVTDGSKAGKRYHASFGAQDIRDLLESTGLSDECSAVKDASFDGGEDVLSLDKEQLFVGMTVVVQDLLKRIAVLEALSKNCVSI